MKLATITAVVAAVALVVLACEPTVTGPKQDVAATSTTSDVALTSTQNLKLPFDDTFFVPCAAGGAGEGVHLTGTMHILEHLTVANSGNTVYKLQFQPGPVKGVGLTTGDTYQGTGAQHVTETERVDGFPYEATYVTNQYVIGPGRGNNLLVHELIHVTFNNNGELTAEVDVLSVDCK